MDQFIDEVNEDLKKEKYEVLWKKYGNLVIAIAVVVLAATAGYSWWKSWSTEKAENDGAAFQSALVAINGANWDDASSKLQALRAESGAGYRGLALIRQAQVQQEQGDLPAALATWESLAADDSVEKTYRDFGLLMSVMVNVDNMDAEAVRSRLSPISHGTSGWRFLAQEQLALALIKAGNKDEARQVLEALTLEQGLPQALSQRIANYLAVLSL